MVARAQAVAQRQKAIPQEGGTKVRVLSVPPIRDRVVQGAFKLMLEPIFEADFQPGSYGYRPKRFAHDAVLRGAEAIVQYKPRVIDVDVQAYFDNIRPHQLLAQVAQRVNDPDVLPGLKRMLHASGKQGVAQGGVRSPLRSQLYLTAVERMLERAKAATRRGPYTSLEYARFADDLVILGDAYPQHDWLLKAVDRRLREELAKLQVSLHEEKSRVVDLAQGESLRFVGFDFRRVRSRQGAWRAWYPPRLKKRTALLRKLKAIFRRYQSQPMDRVIQLINPILRGWVRYCAVGDASRCFGFVKDWVEKKRRRHLMRARNRKGFGWKRWRRQWLYPPPGLAQQLPGTTTTATTTAESTPSTIGLIILDRKRAGKRRAGKPHAAFDVAGAGHVAMVALCTHPAIERAGLETLHLQQARLPSTLPESRERK